MLDGVAWRTSMADSTQDILGFFISFLCSLITSAREDAHSKPHPRFEPHFFFLLDAVLYKISLDASSASTVLGQ
jgi:hypothetical protein